MACVAVSKDKLSLNAIGVCGYRRVAGRPTGRERLIRPPVVDDVRPR
jgi:hypothetical protein